MSGARGVGKSRLAVLAAAIAVSATTALPAAVHPAAAAAESAPIQYELALPSGDGKQGAEPTAGIGNSVGDQGSERPASAAIGALDDGTVILLLALILILTALLLGVALRRQRLRRPRLTAVVAVAGLAITAFLLAVLPAGGTSQRRPPTVPKLYYGVSPQVPEPESEYKRMKANGVDSVRFGIAWNIIEPSKGHYDFSSVDQNVKLIAEAGMEPFPFIGATPNFYGVNCSPATCFTSLPAQNAEQLNAWKNVLRALVKRYGPRGSFWTQNPGIPKHPFRVLQAWNEENFIFFTNPRSPSLFGKLIKASHEAIHGADPGVKTVLGGLFAHPKPSQGLQAATFLNKLYGVKGIKNSFEGVALHPYAKDASDLPGDVNAIRRVMKRHGDENTDLYLTEMGWGSGTDTGFEKGPAGQVRELTQAFTLLRKMQQAARIQRIIWFAWEDDTSPGACNFCDSVGLVRGDGSAKPSLARYSAFAHNKR
jgi:hypothetical protein